MVRQYRLLSSGEGKVLTFLGYEVFERPQQRYNVLAECRRVAESVLERACPERMMSAQSSNPQLESCQVVFDGRHFG